MQSSYISIIIFGQLKAIFTLVISVVFCLTGSAQWVEKIKEIPLHEKSIGSMGFFQDDFNEDGKMEFLADADDKKHLAICTIVNNDINVLHQYTIPDINDFDDFLYVDVDGDGEKEIYIFLDDTGLVQLSRDNLQPIDTISFFSQFTNLIQMTLLDIDLDQQPEWVLLDLTKGLNIIDPVTLTIKLTYPDVDGESFLGGNLDVDPFPELVIRHFGDLYILDPVSGTFVDTIEYVSLYDYQLIDINQQGTDFIVTREVSTIRMYDPVMKKFAGSYSSTSYSFDDFFPFQLDADPQLELVVYSADFSHFVWLNSSPFEVYNSYDIKGRRDVGRFLAHSEFSTDPNDLLFTLEGNSTSEMGLVQFNLLNKEARLTNIRDIPNALNFLPFGSSNEEFILALPYSSNNKFISLLNPEDCSTHFQILGDNIFSGSSDIHQKVSSVRFSGIPERHLLFQNGASFTLYNTQTHLYREFGTYGNYLKYADDLDFDGTSELLVQSINGIQVYSITPGYTISPLFTTPPGSSGRRIVTAQLDKTKTKEIIAFINQNISIYSGDDGHLIRERNNLTNENIVKVLPYRDALGRFYLALVGSSTLFIYGMTENTIVKQFSFGSGNTSSIGNILQFTRDSNIRTYFAMQKDGLRVYDTQGNLYFQDPAIPSIFDQDGEIVIDDFNKNGLPNLLVSTSDAFVELEMHETYQYAKPFYLASIFPKDSAVVKTGFSIILEFSEPINALQAQDHLQMVSANQGVVSFSLVQVGPMQLQLVPQNLTGTNDIISFQMDGNLASTLSHRIDLNYDELSQGDSEPPFTTVYFISPGTPDPNITISPVSILPEIVYSDTKRLLTLEVSSHTTGNNSTPISGLYFSLNGQNEAIALSRDSVYDESDETVMLPLNTFGLDSGPYTLQYFAKDVDGHVSDTSFFVFHVIHEQNNLDKNPGANQQRTSSFNNPWIGSTFEKVTTLSHGEQRLSHVVGGQGTFTYNIYSKAGFGNDGIVRNLNISDQHLNWEINYEMIGNDNPPHQDHGIVYVTSNFSYSIQVLHALDVITGDEIWNEEYETSWGAIGSPVTNNQFLLLPVPQYKGIFCLDRWTGQNRWLGQSQSTGTFPGGPSLFGNKAFVINKENVQAFDLQTGDLKWNIKLRELDTSDPYNAVIDTTNGLIFWPGTTNLYAFDMETGDLKWSKPTGEARSDIIVYKDEVLHFASNQVKLFNAKDGALHHNYAVAGAPTGQPVVANGLLFLPLISKISVIQLDSFKEVWSLPIKVNDISIIDSFLLLTEGSNIHIYKSFSNTVGIKNLAEDQVTIYPNPTSNEISIDVKDHIPQNVSIIDLLGNIHFIGNESTVEIAFLPPGYYFLRIELENKQVVMKRFVKI
jgi:hypothetical protein